MNGWRVKQIRASLLLVNQEHEFSLGNGLDDVARTTGTYDQQPEYTRTIYLAGVQSYLLRAIQFYYAR